MKLFTTIFVILSVFLFSINSYADYAVPADRAVDWTIPYIGVNGDIPSRTTIFKTLTASGSSDSSAIQSAVNSCPSGQVVLLKAGTYNINAVITIPSGVTLRGEGKGVTVLAGTSTIGGNAVVQFNKGSGLIGSSYTPTSLNKGDTLVSFTSIPNWTVGSLVLIDQLNSSVTQTTVTSTGSDGLCGWCGRSNGTRSSGQVNRVIAINGNSVTFETPMAWFFVPSATQFTQIGTVTTSAGVENLTIDNQKSGTSAQGGGDIATFNMYNATQCYLLSVDLNGSYKTMIRIKNSYGNTIRKCNLHEGVPAAFSSGSAAYNTSRAYGIWMGPASNNLIEDNEFYHLAMPVTMNAPTSYNVFSYNVITLIQYSPNPLWNQGTLESHGAHPYMNLFESNITAGRFIADDIWGSASHQTLFRNRMVIPTTMTGALWDIDLQVNSNYFNIINNVIGGAPGKIETVYQWNAQTINSSPAIIRTGYGGDGSGSSSNTLVNSTLIMHGNWDKVHNGVVYKSGETQSFPASMYLTSKPAWWGSRSWPLIGGDVSPVVPDDAYTMPLGKGTVFDSGYNPPSANKTPKAPTNLTVQ